MAVVRFISKNKWQFDIWNQFFLDTNKFIPYKLKRFSIKLTYEHCAIHIPLMMNKRVTIKDVAKMANASVAAVSMTLNNRPGIGNEKRRKIIEVAQKTGYQPSLVAKTLVNRRSYIIGLIINDIADHFFAELAKGVEDTAQKYGYSTILCTTGGNSKTQAEYLDILRSRGVDGIIISTVVAEDPYIEFLINEKIPFVCINRIPLIPSLEKKVEYIIMDNHSAGYKGIEHLWRLGHDKIAIIAGSLIASNAIDTLKGSKAALKKFGLKIPKRYIKEGDYSHREAFLACERLLKGKNPPTAVFAHDDNMALGAREAILRSGLEIPKDIALMGIDDIQIGALTGIELTTISQNKYQMGTMGVDILFNRIEEKVPRMVEKIVLDADLIIRKTCGYHHTGYKR
jgi:LacI family transcriptional regulator